MSDKVASYRANSSFVLYSHMSQQTYFFPKPIWFELHLQEKKNLTDTILSTMELLNFLWNIVTFRNLRFKDELFYRKISLKCIKDLNVRPDMIKLLEENIGKRLYKSQQWLFWAVSQKMKIKTTTKNICDLLKSFCTTKETINKMKRQPADWEKIFGNDVTNKGLVSKIYKQLMKLNINKTNNSIQKCTEDLNRHFSQEDGQMAKRHMKRCLKSLIIREIQIKTTMRYPFTPIKMTTIKKSTNNKCWRGCEEKEILLHSWWECKLV